MSRLRSLLVATSLLLPLPLLATPVATPTAFDRFMGLATGAGKTTVTLASDGTPLAAPGVPTVTTDGGLPKVETTGHVANPAGNRVPVAASARVPAAEVAAATGRLARNLALKAAVVITTGVALYDFAKEIKYILSRKPDGSLEVKKEDPTVCTVAPCYEYNFLNSEGGVWRSTPLAAANDLVAKRATQGIYLTLQSCDWNPAAPANVCVFRLQSGSLNYAGAPNRGAAVSQPVYLPSNLQELTDAIASQSGWPATSKVGQMLEDAARETGVKTKVGPMTVTGPATSPGKVSTTQNTTNNTTKTETTTYNHTYNGDTITTTAVTVTNITNNTTGETVSQETKTETPEKEEDPEDYTANDTPLPQQPKLYTPKYPNGLEGVWTQQKANLTATPLANLIGRLMPNVGSSGSCPVMNVDFTFATWADYGIRDVAPPCYVWDWGRIIILVSALLLARALIFGG